jgi:hypothetical protein
MFCLGYCIHHNFIHLIPFLYYRHWCAANLVIIPSAKIISVQAERLRQSGQAQSGPSETTWWRIAPHLASIPSVVLHIALQSLFGHFIFLCPSPIIRKHSGVGANGDHMSEWVHWVHACIRIEMPDAAKISHRVPSTWSSRSIERKSKDVTLPCHKHPCNRVNPRNVGKS